MCSNGVWGLFCTNPCFFLNIYYLYDSTEGFASNHFDFSLLENAARLCRMKEWNNILPDVKHALKRLVVVFLLAGTPLTNTFGFQSVDDSARVMQLLIQARDLRYVDDDSAISLATRAYRIARESKDLKLLLYVKLRFADVYVTGGNMILAVEYYFKAQNLLMEASKPSAKWISREDYLRKLVLTKTEIAYCYFELKRVALAASFYIEALAIMADANEVYPGIFSPADFATVQSSLAGAYLADENISEAKHYLLTAFTHLASLEDTALIATLYTNMGIVMQEEDQLDTALIYHQKARELRQAINDHKGLAGIYNNLGRYYELVGDTDHAIFYYDSAWSLAAQENMSRSLQIAANSLADIYAQKGQYRKAFEMSSIVNVLNDSIFNQRKVYEVTRLALQYRFDQETRLQELAYDDMVKRQKRRQMAWAMVAIIALLLTLVLVLLIKNQRGKLRFTRLESEKQRLEHEAMEVENQRARIDIEQRNRELAANAMHLIQKNEFISEVAERLINFRECYPPDSLAVIDQVIRQLHKQTDENTWKEFEVRFLRVHPGFFQTLQSGFPHLSSSEIKLASFLRLNLTTKDIAAITRQNPDSLKVARSRLRKKLGLTSCQNLVSFLTSIH